MEEDMWLNCQLVKYRDNMKSINLGEYLMKEFCMYSLGVPIGKRFMAAAMQVFNERFRLIMKMHPEFNDLPGNLQHRLWRNNIWYCVALNMTKLETSTSAEEQMDFACGYSDFECVKFFVDRSKTGQSSITKLKKLTLQDHNKTAGLLSQGLMQNFVRLIGRIGDFIKDKQLYQLLSIILMFSDVDTKDMKKLHQLKNKYMNVIRRKVEAQIREGKRRAKKPKRGAGTCESDSSDDDDDDFEEIEVGATIIDRLNSCICDVKELATIIVKLGPPPGAGPGGPPEGPPGGGPPEGSPGELVPVQNSQQPPPCMRYTGGMGPTGMGPPEMEYISTSSGLDSNIPLH